MQDQGAPGHSINGLVEQSCWGGQGGDKTDEIREQLKTSGTSLVPQPASLPYTDTHLQDTHPQAGSTATCTPILTPGQARQHEQAHMRSWQSGRPPTCPLNLSPTRRDFFGDCPLA